MQFTDILLLVVVIVAIVVFVLYMLNRWAYKKMDSQSSMIEKTKTTQQYMLLIKDEIKLLMSICQKWLSTKFLSGASL